MPFRRRMAGQGIEELFGFLGEELLDPLGRPFWETEPAHGAPVMQRRNEIGTELISADTSRRSHATGRVWRERPSTSR